MKKYFISFFGIITSFLSCQPKENNDFENGKRVQIESNQKVINALRNEGDKLTAEREVFHWIYFKSEDEKSSYLKEVMGEGFKFVSLNKIEDKLPFQLQIKRIDKVDIESVNDYVIYLWEKAIEHGGEYDGWETSVEK